MKKFPETFKQENYFPSPIFVAEAPEMLDDLNNYSESYIENAKKLIEEKKKKLNFTENKIGDVYHSISLINDKNFNPLIEYINNTSFNILEGMGYDLKTYKVLCSELWVQEFSKEGGGHHETHTHWNGHMSGFYFLKCSDKTSRPLFHDPRPGNVMNLLPEKDVNKLSTATSTFNCSIKPGLMIFFPSYMPHSFLVDRGLESFRFIHWNCRAYPKHILKGENNV